MLSIFGLLSLSASKIPLNPDGTVDMEAFLAMEDKPFFQELPTDDEEFDLEGKVGVDVEIASAQASAKRVNQYYMSSVKIKDGLTFSKCYAFGAGPATGSGGAIFLSYSSLTSSNGGIITFTQNIASVGGAICTLASPVYLNPPPKFEENVAYKYGGAIYFQGVFEKKKKIPIFMYIVKALIFTLDQIQLNKTNK